MFKLVDRSKGYLFASIDLRQIIESTHSALRSEIEEIEANRFLNTAPADLARYLVEKYQIHPPELRRDEWVADESEIQVDVRHEPRYWIDDRSRPVLVPGQRITIEVPVSGNVDLLYARASTVSPSPPRAQIQDSKLILTFDIAHDHGEIDVKQQAERTLAEVEQHIGWIRADLASYNAGLNAAAESAIAARRERLLVNQGRVASLGIPMKRREGAPQTYALPEVRRRVFPPLPPASSMPFTPEPALDMATYEHILSVIQNMTHVMERSPSAFRAMGEEDIRQHFLVQLNGQFEGAATGETFNVNGKTDILLRANDRNVFVAECKFWKGPKHYGETITQLLSYTGWRDTKTAILVFNRDTALSTVLSGIDAETKKHPQFKQQVNWPHETGFRYVLHYPSDANREVITTVLAFDVPSAT